MTDHTHPEPIRLVVQKTEHGTFAIVPAMVAREIVALAGVITMPPPAEVPPGHTTHNPVLDNFVQPGSKMTSEPLAFYPGEQGHLRTTATTNAELYRLPNEAELRAVCMQDHQNGDVRLPDGTWGKPAQPGAGDEEHTERWHLHPDESAAVLAQMVKRLRVELAQAHKNWRDNLNIALSERDLARAERERDEARDSQRRLIDESHLLATLPGVSHGPQIFRQAVAAVQMSNAERDAALARAEKAERERDEANADRSRLIRNVREGLGIGENTPTVLEAHRIRRERDHHRAAAEKLAGLLGTAVSELEQQHLPDTEAKCLVCGCAPGEPHKADCDVPNMRAALAEWRKGEKP